MVLQTVKKPSNMTNVKAAGPAASVKVKDLVLDLVDLRDPTNIYLAVVFLTGVIQFIYVILVGTFPFNAFLAGFLSCVTSFVLGVCLKKTGEFKGFLFAHLVLHLAVLMLIG